MRALLAALLLAAAALANAQEGFPLDGTWRGERAGGGGAPATIVMVLQWDGQKLTGVINPGPKAVPITDGQLIPEGWRVSVAGKTAAGAAIGFEGTLADLGKYNRTITGTWTEGGRKYSVRMVRE
ncbi:MAG: hypothetical protein WDO56_28820 [Gammaproteobacteria bacterium]